MNKPAFILLLAATHSAIAFSQNLNGFWKGTFAMRGCFPNNNIELQINISNGMATGDSYHYQDIDNYVKKKFTGIYDAERKKLSLREGMVVTYHIPHRCVICVKDFELVYSREGNVEILKGQWGGNVINSAADCGIGPIILTRVKESAFKEIPEIKVDTGTIRLDFYDNAVVDGDSISVKVNNRLVISHQRLTAKPITTHLLVDLNNAFHEIEMIADNMGSITPNTAILVVTAGEQQHRLFLSSSETKSARVRFVYETAQQAGPVQR
ncbi:MAG: hypothetical protein JNK14_15400 [Chitinophagaceae bacterium]|nr:hypothetical protein [Chitinophagaceae bacterium]